MIALDHTEAVRVKKVDGIFALTVVIKFVKVGKIRVIVLPIAQ